MSDSRISNYGPESVDGAKAMLIIDGRIDMRNHLGSYYIRKPGEEVRFRSEPAQNDDTSAITFSIVTPNKNTAIDKRIFLKVKARFTFSGDAGVDGQGNPNKLLPSVTYNGEEYLAGETDALRFLPIQSVAKSVRFSFNSSDVSQNSSDFIEPLCRYGYTKENLSEEYSTFPSMMDMYQEYNDFTVWGDAKNPLASYGNNSAQQPRGALSYVFVKDDNKNPINTQTSAVLEVEWMEPVLLSPLQVDRLVQRAFLGITEIDARFNMSSDISRMWSHDAVGNPVLSGPPVVDFAGQKPELRLNYINLVPGSVPPLTNNYPYYRPVAYPTTLGNVDAGDTVQRELQNIQLSSIPSRIYIFARQTNGKRTYVDTDSYMRLKFLNIQFDNRAGRLSEAKPRDLYQICVRNGCKMSWTEWYDKVGSVMCVDFGRDVGLRDYQTPGMRGQYQLQIAATLQNIGSKAKDFTIWLVVMYEGAFKIVDTQTFVQTGDVYPINVKEAALGKVPDVALIHEADAFNYNGGSFLGRIKKWAQHSIPYALKAADAIKKYGPAVASLLAAAGTTGAGMSGEGMSGGRRMSRYSLSDRMQ